ncbi:hypothetical protein N7495_004724 [Penicillium taxi]|uniref:uncharacterized protein n=1 Tax=Penicillium taxi TaxID=168475 RepID=UPI0025451567|nr:uncharacterized protein N7495_004724 [Penicillium taxi]KAJ5899980.1 hypothetical protein N7495_004724 [Penicillium taxi]
MAPSEKNFKSDDSVLNPAIKSHIKTLYTALDSKDMQTWGAHFAEDAEMTMGPFTVKGRDSLIEAVTGTSADIKTRDHTIDSVFPFGPDADEVMLHGSCDSVTKDDQASTSTWAAIMHFKRSGHEDVLVDRYTVFVVLG